VPRLEFTPEVMQAILDVLKQKALEELGFAVDFKWPKEMSMEEPSLIAVPEKPLTEDQTKKLWTWLERTTGARPLSLWDRLRRDDGVF
jgi:hypothetical protein